MVEVNESLTRQVAHLARLELSDEEVKTFTSQLGNILQYVEQLHEVNVEGVEPMVHSMELESALRPDEVRAFPAETDGTPKVLGSAPEVLFDGYKVPPIL